MCVTLLLADISAREDSKEDSVLSNLVRVLWENEMMKNDALKLEALESEVLEKRGCKNICVLADLCKAVLFSKFSLV